MKKYLIVSSLVVFMMSFSQLEAQIDNAQWTVITKKTADWCPNCGNWGWDAFENIIEDLEGKKAIMIAMHQGNSALTNETATALTDNFNSSGQPLFFLNNDNQGLLSGNQSTKRTEIIEQVDYLQTLAGVTGIELNATTDGAKLFASASVEFFGTLTNEFSIGVYVIQNNIVHNQASQGMVAHPKLLTGRMTDDAFGDILDPSIAVHNVSYEMPVPADFDFEETEIVAVVWLKDTNGVYRFNNANIDEEVELILSNDELDQLVSDFTAQINNDQLLISLALTESLAQGQVHLTDISGKNIFSKQLGNLPSGTQKLSYDLGAIPSGIYVVNLEIDGEIISKKVFK